jgi:hypothetical protein
MDDLALNDMALILDVDINARVSIEIQMSYNKPFLLTEK